MPTVRETLGLDTHSVDSTATPPEETGEVQDEGEGSRITVKYHGPGVLDKVELSASTARLMLLILNSMPLQGGAFKIQIGVAQQEIEEALKSLEAKNPRIKTYPIRTATRAEKRRANRV